ncbi:hypothetical protein GGF43_004509 [Coemansia sp. RSA 2618]|nr:hypothetical protein GGF43_004509 [Coemansia sp. RSA 2618]
MWSQLLLLAGAFGLGYYVATRGSGKKTESLPSESDSQSSMVGAFPEHSSNSKGDIAGGKTAKSKRKKPGKPGQKQEPMHSPAQPDMAEVKVKAKAVEPSPSAATAYEPKQEKEPALQPEAEPEIEKVLDTEPVLAPDSQPDEWEAVGTSGVRPAIKQSNPIPVHKTAWSSVTDNVDLSQNEVQHPPQHRVLRIGARAQPPPPPAPPRREYKGPQPLTKKQKQSRKKAERIREERAQAAAIQEQRLHSHQKDLFELRSRKQWEQEQRKAIHGPPKGKAPSHAKNAPSLIDGKLIWD